MKFIQMNQFQYSNSGIDFINLKKKGIPYNLF